MAEGKLKPSECIIQVAATICISFMAYETGLVTSWPSITTVIFKSNNTVLSEPMSSMHISLLGSLPNIGGLIVCPFCSYAFNKFGRKYATILFGLPFLISWAIISMTDSITVVLIAVSIAGAGIAGQYVSVIYISEICHDSIRGALTALAGTGYFLGILGSNLMGGFMTYTQVVNANLTLAVVTIGLLLILKESPVFLLMVGKEEEAKKSIAFYRRIDMKSKEMETELSNIKATIDPDLEKRLDAAVNEKEAGRELITSKEKTRLPPSNPLKSSKMPPSLRFFLNSKSSKRALTTCLIIVCLAIMMGCLVLQVYAEPLFLEAVPSMPPNLCAIYVAVDFVIASLVCIVAIEMLGRKLLCIVSAILSGICTLLLATQLQFHWAPHWFTAFLIYTFSFVFTSGMSTVPFVLAAEVFLPEVRSLCNSTVLFFVWLCNFITLLIFNPLVESIGLGGVYYIFSSVCFIGAAYSYFYIPETGGLSVADIQKEFLKEKKK